MKKESETANAKSKVKQPVQNNAAKMAANGALVVVTVAQYLSTLAAQKLSGR